MKEKPRIKLSFNDWCLSPEAVSLIEETLPAGKTILELGSGWTSGKLSQKYRLYSVEHDLKFLDLYESVHYIHAPLIQYYKSSTGLNYVWYDKNILRRELPKTYDLLLIDGPPGSIGRMGFFHNLRLFNTDVTMLFDDIDRPEELQLIEAVSKNIGRGFSVQKTSTGRSFGVIYSNVAP